MIKKNPIESFNEQEDAGPGEGKEVHEGAGAGKMDLLCMRSGSLISFEI